MKKTLLEQARLVSPGLTDDQIYERLKRELQDKVQVIYELKNERGQLVNALEDERQEKAIERLNQETAQEVAAKLSFGGKLDRRISTRKAVEILSEYLFNTGDRDLDLRKHLEKFAETIYYEGKQLFNPGERIALQTYINNYIRSYEGRD